MMYWMPIVIVLEPIWIQTMMAFVTMMISVLVSMILGIRMVMAHQMVVIIVMLSNMKRKTQ